MPLHILWRNHRESFSCNLSLSLLLSCFGIETFLAEHVCPTWFGMSLKSLVPGPSVNNSYSWFRIECSPNSLILKAYFPNGTGEDFRKWDLIWRPLGGWKQGIEDPGPSPCLLLPSNEVNGFVPLYSTAVMLQGQKARRPRTSNTMNQNKPLLRVS